MTCPLCNAIKNEAEEVWIPPLYDGGTDFEILSTKNLKGHKYRYMIVSRIHTKEMQDFDKLYALGRLTEFMLGRCPEDFVILETTHASIPDHWHRVASDLVGEDMELIAKTSRLLFVHRKQ